MANGRPPKPVEVKRRTGNPGRRPLPEPVVAVPAVIGTPDMPAGLQAAGRRFWEDVWALGQAWLIPGLDALVIEQAARGFDEIAGWRREVVKFGRIIEQPVVNKAGDVVGVRLVANPAVKSLRECERGVERWLVLSGIPPTARAQLGWIQVKAQSKLEALFADK